MAIFKHCRKRHGSAEHLQYLAKWNWEFLLNLLFAEIGNFELIRCVVEFPGHFIIPWTLYSQFLEISLLLKSWPTLQILPPLRVELVLRKKARYHCYHIKRNCMEIMCVNIIGGGGGVYWFYLFKVRFS